MLGLRKVGSKEVVLLLRKVVEKAGALRTVVMKVVDLLHKVVVKAGVLHKVVVKAGVLHKAVVVVGSSCYEALKCDSMVADYCCCRIHCSSG